eukprot:CAMPEP_0170564240 /NCGR_PEP_ID=MMETSP0211-20121228/71799_1 /TAXON_ID=311385 /ORGANISM="Pseudokeronopsis sp., Strain OXSARD2" /LENGTH=33 /DNA_ID= /DNA_START= /DNA_END= /DNA_ORIENTATION=
MPGTFIGRLNEVVEVSKEESVEDKASEPLTAPN